MKHQGAEPKIIFDLDGTLTDFNKFIRKNAIKYFEKKYHLSMVHPDALEIEDIFDILRSLEKSGYSTQDAVVMQKHMLDRFWVSHRFIMFSLLGRFRPGAKQVVNMLKKSGFRIEIHSSRAKTSERSMLGWIARCFTAWQFRLNGIFLKKDQFFYYVNDSEKLEGVLNAHPLFVIDDKPCMLKHLTEHGLKTICVAGTHNQTVPPFENMERIDSFRGGGMERKVEKLLGKSNWECHKKEAASARFFCRLTWAKAVIEKIFRPVVLHSENRLLEKEKGVIYAPNHRSTLDPLLIESVIMENVHWAALARFFRGEDSLFNNSKNPVLCRVTKYVFYKLEYFPIDRKRDNPYANNITSINNMCLFLKNKYKIGIFAEGTTRRPVGQDFGEFDDSFLRIARKTEAWIQPITLFWTGLSGKRCKVIVNFGKPFQLKDMEVDDGMRKFLEIQKNALRENQEAFAKLI